MGFHTDPEFENKLGSVRFHQSWAFRFESTDWAKTKNNIINNNKWSLINLNKKNKNKKEIT